MRKNVVIILLLLVNIFSVKYAVVQKNEADVQKKATRDALEMHARYLKGPSEMAQVKMVEAKTTKK